MKVIVGAKSAAKTVCATFTPQPRNVQKKYEQQAMIFDEESASDAQKFLALSKRRILENKIDANMFEEKNAKQICWASKNEHADRRHVRG